MASACQYVCLPIPLSLPLHSNLNLVILAHDRRCPRNNYITGHYHISLQYTSPLPLSLSLSLYLPFFSPVPDSCQKDKKSFNKLLKNLNHLKLSLQGILHSILQGTLQGSLATRNIAIVIVVLLLNLRVYLPSSDCID